MLQREEGHHDDLPFFMEKEMKTTAQSYCMVVGLALSLVTISACATPHPTLSGKSLKPPLIQQPWSTSSTHPEIKPLAKTPWKPLKRSRKQRSGIIEVAYYFYSNYLTKVDGARCEHRPTCSRYGIESMRKHGFIFGSWLTIDRLLRSGRSSTLRALPLKEYHGGLPYYSDPVEENDFFF